MSLEEMTEEDVLINMTDYFNAIKDKKSKPTLDLYLSNWESGDWKEFVDKHSKIKKIMLEIVKRYNKIHPEIKKIGKLMDKINDEAENKVLKYKNG
jgi:uncharacterized protein YktB (UPF0637 family)